MEPLVRFNKWPTVKFTTGRSNASVQGSQGRNSPGSRSWGRSGIGGGTADFISIIGIALFGAVFIWSLFHVPIKRDPRCESPAVGGVHADCCRHATRIRALMGV